MYKYFTKREQKIIKSGAIRRLSSSMTEKELLKLQYENKCLQKGYKLIAGCDEVGRGPLAGPVVCCAVIMPLNEEDIIEGIDDSKKVSEKKRERLAGEILAKAIAVAAPMPWEEPVIRMDFFMGKTPFEQVSRAAPCVLNPLSV